MLPSSHPSHRLRVLLTLAGLLLSGLVAAQSGGGRFRITHEAIAAGGTRSAADATVLTGTVAQAAAAERSNHRFRLRGGFHRARTLALGDALFRDGFESP